MEGKKNLFILGAGSSASYGFPTGEQLKSVLLSGKASFIEDHELAEVFDRYYDLLLSNIREKIGKEELSKFQEDFKLSGSYTIDTFLSSDFRSEVQKLIGALLVAGIITFFETISTLMTSPQDDWISYFIRRLISYNEESFLFSKSNNIITFNYDSFLEQKIRTYYEKHFPVNHWSSIVKKQEIFTHVYGRLNTGKYPDLTLDQTDPTLDFYLKENGILEFDSLLEKAKRISFVRNSSEDNNETTEKLYKIQEMVDDADNIYILGYGFDQFNNRILFKDEENLRKIIHKIRYTTYGLPDPILYYLESLRLGLNEFTVSSEEVLKKEKCLDFIMSEMPPQLFPTQV